MPILGSQSSGAKGAPTVPTVGTATVTNSTTVSLTFTAPSSKLPITSYTATSSPSISLSTSGTTSPVTITGTFASGTAYTFTLAAVNANGTSTASSASNSVTPNIPKFIYFSRGSESPTVYKFDVPSDTRSTLASSALTPGQEYSSCASNSGTAGYYAGGLGSGVISSIRKLTFSSDAFSLISATMSQSKYTIFGVANSGTAGYFAGGYDNDTGYYSRVDKLLFSNDTTSNLGNILGSGKGGNAGNGTASNNGVAGYIAGGRNQADANLVTQEKINYSNDSRTSVTSIGSGNSVAGLANSGTAAYYGGGFVSSTAISFIQKMTFSNESVATLSSRLSVARNAGGAASNNGVAGYWAGGRNAAFASLSTIDKMPFSTDTSSESATSLGGTSASGPLHFANVGTL